MHLTACEFMEWVEWPLHWPGAPKNVQAMALTPASQRYTTSQ